MCNSDIHLSGEDAKRFWQDMNCIDHENQRKINALFEECSRLDIKEKDDGTIICEGVEIIEDLGR